VKEEERKNYLQGKIGSAAAVMEDCKEPDLNVTFTSPVMEDCKEPDLNVTFTSPSAYVLCCNAHA